MKQSLRVVAGLALALQAASAMVRSDFDTPNASTAIAANLLSAHEYVMVGGPNGPAAPTPRRSFQLPGEPLYLAAGFWLLPRPLQRLIHLPVAVGLVVAIAAVAAIAGGSRAGLATGVVASVEPFLLRHGPVWDDTFLAAALEWTVFALLLSRLNARTGTRSSPHWTSTAAVALCAGWAAITRLEAQAVLSCVALALLVLRPFKPLRSLAWAMIGGMSAALGAWGLRNWLVVGAFFVGSTHDGQTLLQSTHARAAESIVRTGVAQNLLETTAPPGSDELAEDRRYAHEAWREIASRPFHFLGAAALKTAVSLTGIDFAKPVDSVRNVVAVSSNVLLLLIGPAGWLQWRVRMRTQPRERLVSTVSATVIGVTAVALALGPVGLRYRICLTGFLLTGVGLRISRAGRSRQPTT